MEANNRMVRTRTETREEEVRGSGRAQLQCFQRRAPSNSCRWLPVCWMELATLLTQILSHSNPYAASLSQSCFFPVHTTQHNPIHSSVLITKMIKKNRVRILLSYKNKRSSLLPSSSTYQVNFPPEAPTCLRGFLTATGDFRKPAENKRNINQRAEHNTNRYTWNCWGPRNTNEVWELSSSTWSEVCSLSCSWDPRRWWQWGAAQAYDGWWGGEGCGHFPCKALITCSEMKLGGGIGVTELVLRLRLLTNGREIFVADRLLGWAVVQWYCATSELWG